jgi:hypothetical protein
LDESDGVYRLESLHPSGKPLSLRMIVDGCMSPWELIRSLVSEFGSLSGGHRKFFLVSILRHISFNFQWTIANFAMNVVLGTIKIILFTAIF